MTAKVREFCYRKPVGALGSTPSQKPKTCKLHAIEMRGCMDWQQRFYLLVTLDLLS